MPALGAPELIIILVIIILIFGVGKLPEVGQALGKGIREFRGAADDENKQDDEPKPAPAVEAPRPVAAVPAPQPRTDTVTQPAEPVAVGTPVAAPVAAAATATAPTAPSATKPSATAPAPAPTAGAAPTTIAYTVESGDTLESIAQRHGVGIEAVMAANGYSQRDRVLYAGDRIQVPTSA